MTSPRRRTTGAWIRTALLIAAIGLCAQSAGAIMATPTDKYEEAPTETVETLKSLSQTERYLQGTGRKALVMQFVTETKKRYLIVRFDSPHCEDWCPNAIFENGVSSDGFVALAILPRKSTLGDVARPTCRNCERQFPLVFVGEDGRSKAFYLTDEGLIF